MNKTKLILLILGTLFLLTACEDSEKGKLDNRINAYWQHKINKEYGKAYEFTTPGYRKLVNKEDYILKFSNNNIEWVGSKLKNKKCEKKEVCTAILMVTYKYNMKLGMAGSEDVRVDTELKERWLIKDNTWYIVQK